MGGECEGAECGGGDHMRLPVIFNSNFQVQDQDGVTVADLWKNPNRIADGMDIVKQLNAGGFRETARESVSIGSIFEINGERAIVIKQEEYKHLCDLVRENLYDTPQNPVGDKQETNGNGHFTASEAVKSLEDIKPGFNARLQEVTNPIVEAVVESALTESCNPRKRKLSKAERSEKMKEAWRKRREAKASM